MGPSKKQSWWLPKVHTETDLCKHANIAPALH